MATNYSKLVRQLQSERTALQNQIDQLTKAIDALNGSSITGRRGRRRRRGAGTPTRAKSRRRGMSAAARRAISLRMKKYWAARRKTAAS
jgi:hypothetical protein